MKKLKLSLLLIFVFSIIQLSAQDSLSIKKDSLKKTRSKASFLAFDLGGNLPLGKFAQSTSPSNGSGFAAPGFSYRVELAIIGRKNFGFGAMYGGFTNNIDAASFGASSNLIVSNFPITYVSQGEKGNYFSQYYYVGPIITLPFKNVFIDFKTMFGLMRSQYPNFGFTGQINEFGNVRGTSILIVADKAKSDFAYNLGTNIRLKLSESVQFKTSIEFMYARPLVNYTILEANLLRKAEVRQAISTLNFTWGLAFKL